MKMNENYLKRITTLIVLIALIVLSFFLLKPILLSIIIAIILAFVFNPVYKWVTKIVKSKNISAFIICTLLVTLIILPMWFLTPIVIKQSIKIYTASQQVDFVTPIKKIFPSLFVSEEFSEAIGSVTHSFVTKATNSIMNSLADIISDFANILLQLLVVFFTLFFILRDGDKLLEYIKSLMPFSDEVQSKLFTYSKDITKSVLYGQIVLGIIQGILVGISFFIFSVPNALLLTLFAVAAGVFPIIGTTVVWIPVAIYFFVAGNTFPAIGIIVFGTIASILDNFLKPIFVSQRTKIHSSIILIGMVGGFFLFGILGFILGPLILEYLLIILELYRDKTSRELFTEPDKE